MPFVDYISEKNSLIGIWKNTEEVDKLLMLYKPTKKELTIFNNIKLVKRQKEYLITRLLLKEIHQEKVEILKEENGKPYLVNSKVEISITHADDYSAVLRHEELECGVDMEEVQPRITRIVNKFSSQYEQLYVTEGRERLHFTIVWCIKEAVYKWYAKGKVDFKQQIMLHPFTADKDANPGQVYLEFLLDGNKQILRANYKVLDNNVLAWVSG